MPPEPGARTTCALLGRSKPEGGEGGGRGLPFASLTTGTWHRLLPFPSLQVSPCVLSFASPITKELHWCRSPAFHSVSPASSHSARLTVLVELMVKTGFPSRLLMINLGEEKSAYSSRGWGRLTLTKNDEQRYGGTRIIKRSLFLCFVHLRLTYQSRNYGFYKALYLPGMEGILQTTCA